jgi:hypothetical protein
MRFLDKNYLYLYFFKKLNYKIRIAFFKTKFWLSLYII